MFFYLSFLNIYFICIILCWTWGNINGIFPFFTRSVSHLGSLGTIKFSSPETHKSTLFQVGHSIVFPLLKGHLKLHFMIFSPFSRRFTGHFCCVCLFDKDLSMDTLSCSNAQYIISKSLRLQPASTEDGEIDGNVLKP